MYNRRKYITGRPDFCTHVRRENMNGRAIGDMNMNYCRTGVRNLKGYGPTFSPLDSARLKERVGMARIEYGTEQFRMHRASGPTRGCESGELERRVQQSLKQVKSITEHVYVRNTRVLYMKAA